MVCKIIWSPKAIETYMGNVEYLIKNWTEKEVKNFILKVEAKLKLLQAQPRLGVLINKRKNIHRTILHKRVALVYHYYPKKNTIELITFWNNAQNPNKLKY